MQEQIIKRVAPNWKLGLSYFGYVFIGIFPLNVFTSILSQYGNNTYRLIIAGLYIIILPFWVKRTVITATALFMRRYYVPKKSSVLPYTIIYFLVIWFALLFRVSHRMLPVIIASAVLEIYLLSWLTWYSLKYLQTTTTDGQNLSQPPKLS